MDLQFAEKLGKEFEAKYGIATRVERSGAERVFTRIAQEYASNVHVVDVVNTSDQAHCLAWKRDGWMAPYLPEEVVQNYDPAYYDVDGQHVTTRVLVSPIGINTNLVKMEDAPKSFADLLNPKWAGKMVKAHPAYSGTIMNSTFQVARELGWEYFEKLARQRVMQVQSATDTPKKLALGERAIMVDGAGYLVIRDKEAGKPVDVIYPTEGTPVATSPSAVFKAAPNPNAARLFQSWMHGREGQQTPHRLRTAIFRPQAGGGEAGRQEARRVQADEGGPGRGGKRRRGSEAALRADFQGVMQILSSNSIARHSGAPQGEPGIHNPSSWLWIPARASLGRDDAHRVDRDGARS